MGFELRFTDKEITAWGGMGLMKRMLDRIDFDSALEACDFPKPGSNRGYSPTQLLLQFMLSVWCGANCFEHLEVTRHDPVLQKLFGFKRMANFKAIMRLFRKFDQATVMRVFGRLYRWFFGNLHIDHLTLDLDSTVMTRYGQQEGAARGYNPRKPGRNSHHPLMAFVADIRMIANLWLRPGNSHSANNVLAFLDDSLDKLGGKRVALLRADIRKDPVFACYRYSALVTDMDLPAVELWRLYRGRADCENRIKELKYDFGADSFNLKDFWATEAALLTVMLAYNQMSLFRQGILRSDSIAAKPDVQHTLKTLRYKLFAKAGYITKDSRKKIINLAVAMRQREWFEGLWDRSRTFTLPVKFTPIFSP